MCCTPDQKFKIKYNTSLVYNTYTLLAVVVLFYNNADRLHIWDLSLYQLNKRK